MKYRIYEGGNKRNFPWENYLNSENTHDVVRIASHLKTRHKVIEFHLDFGDERIRNWMANTGITKLTAASSDELVTHLLPAGALIEQIVVQVKSPVSAGGGPTPTAEIIHYGNASATPLPLVGGKTPDEVTDDSAQTTGTAGATGVIGAPLVVDLTVPGWFYFPVNAFTQDEGELSFKPTVDLAAGCVSIYVGLIDFASEHKCECAPPQCTTTYPDPIDC